MYKCVVPGTYAIELFLNDSTLIFLLTTSFLTDPRQLIISWCRWCTSPRASFLPEIFFSRPALKRCGLSSHRENFHTRLAGSRPQLALAMTRISLSSAPIISDLEISRDFRTFPRLCHPPTFLLYFSQCPSPLV